MMRSKLKIITFYLSLSLTPEENATHCVVLKIQKIGQHCVILKLLTCPAESVLAT